MPFSNYNWSYKLSVHLNQTTIILDIICLILSLFDLDDMKLARKFVLLFLDCIITYLGVTWSFNVTGVKKVDRLQIDITI